MNAVQLDNDKTPALGPVWGRLLAAKSRLADPTAWCKANGAEDREGRMVAAYSKTACAWCLFGALIADSTDKFALDKPASTADALVIEAINQRWPERVTEFTGLEEVGFNDHPQTTHDDVMAVLDVALELAKERHL